MKFKVLSTDLMGHLSTISRVLSSKSAMPILENFLFEIDSDKLTVTASDGDTTMITRMAISDVEGSGKLCVPAKNLLDPLKEMPQQLLSFEVDNDNLEVFVVYENGKYNFIALNADEYPVLKPMEPTAQTFSLPALSLLSGLQSTLFATAEDDLRPVMNGVNFDIREDQLIFVASDAQKLVRLINNAVKPGFVSTFILPRKPATLLKGVIAKDMEEASITFDSKSARFQLGDYLVSCRLIEGKYPRYESVIPKNNTNIVTIDRQTFINVLRRVSIFSNSATNQVKLDIDRDKIVVSAQDVDFSISATETVACTYDGPEIEIGFRANFLIEILNTLSGDSVELKLADAYRAGLLVPVENNENEDLLMLIMPMKLVDF